MHTHTPVQFLVLYKRPGHRVLVNKLGDLVVRPNYVETAIRGVPGGALTHACQPRCCCLRRGCTAAWPGL